MKLNTEAPVYIREVGGPGTMTVRDHYFLAALTGILANPSNGYSYLEAVRAANEVTELALSGRK